MQSEDHVSEEITIIVPRLRDVSGREAMGKIYAPESGGLDEGNPEGEFVEGLIRIFDARLRAIPTPENGSEPRS